MPSLGRTYLLILYLGRRDKRVNEGKSPLGIQARVIWETVNYLPCVCGLISVDEWSSGVEYPYCSRLFTMRQSRQSGQTSGLEN
jgi:hypothetical protein